MNATDDNKPLEPIMHWIDEHPRTMIYITLVVTATFVLQIIELGLAN